MDKAQAIHAFWSQFGLDAYDENTVPTNNPPTLPYITYSVSTAALDEPVQLTASLWFYSSSWAEITAKADEVASLLGVGGVINEIDGGYAWFMRGSPFSQRMAEDNDMIRRIVLNVQAEFLTAY